MREPTWGTWALLAVSVLCLPKWGTGLLAFASPGVWSDHGVIVAGGVALALLATAGGSVALFNHSQTLSAIFGLAAAAYARTPLTSAGFESSRYPVELFLPVIFWTIAATYPSPGGRLIRNVALSASAVSAAFFVVLLGGRSPYPWNPIYADPSHDLITVSTLLALVAIRLRCGSFRPMLRKGFALLRIFSQVGIGMAIFAVWLLLARMGVVPGPWFAPELPAAAGNVLLAFCVLRLAYSEATSGARQPVGQEGR